MEVRGKLKFRGYPSAIGLQPLPAFLVEGSEGRRSFFGGRISEACPEFPSCLNARPAPGLLVTKTLTKQITKTLRNQNREWAQAVGKGLLPLESEFRDSL